MQIIDDVAYMQFIATKLIGERKAIGFVPTMGALHEGHIALVREACRMSDIVIVSIFINPTQFGDQNDFNLYPRNLSHDAEKLSPLGVDYIFTPLAEDIYPEGFSTWVDVEELTNKLEGVSRPGHFRGVTTVLSILFNIVRPTLVFMGQKDAQQTIVTKKLVKDLQIPTEIVVVPTVREPSGLALSSRNQMLLIAEKNAASSVFRGLQEAEKLFANGEKDVNKLVNAIEKEIINEPLLQVDYIAVTDSENLNTLETVTDNKVLISLAVKVGSTRLIDNILLNQIQEN